MRRALVLLGFAGGLLFMSGSAAAVDVDWKSLPYFNPLAVQIWVPTNDSWRGAKAVPVEPQYKPSSNPWYPKVDHEYIWAPSCGSAAQRVAFTKTFLSPGKPFDGSLAFGYGVGNQFYGGRPYTSAVMRVNGVEIARLGNIHRSPRTVGWGTRLISLPPRTLNAIHYGANTLTIQVERAALKRGEPCTKPYATYKGNLRHVGVLADLTLGYAADVRVRTPDVASQHALVGNGKSATIQGMSRLTNEGPSSALDGTFSVSVTGPGQAALALAQPQPPLEDCEKTLARITCHFDEVKPGQTTGVNIIAGTEVNYGYFRNGAGKMTLEWSVSARGRDPNGGNNSTQVDLLLCAPEATDPGCGG